MRTPSKQFSKLQSELFKGLSTKFQYPIWAYLLLPLTVGIAAAIEGLSILIGKLVLNPVQTINEISSVFN